MPNSEVTTFSKGLEDVIAAESALCLIDGKNSKLSYRGYDIHDLAQYSTYEETAYLLYHGKLPTVSELRDFSSKIAAQRELPKEVTRFISTLPKNISPMAALRTSVSYLSFFDPESESKSDDANVRKALRLISQVPEIVAYFARHRKDLPAVAPKKDPQVSIAANFLYMLKGREATPIEIKMLDKYFILLTEHDLNASTFAGRITASTQSDIYSAVVSAIGTLKGDLHGFANTRTMESLLAIGDENRVESFVEETLAKKEKFMGFGHRIYKGPDPRAFDLKQMSKTLADANPDQAKWYRISEKLEKVVWEKKKLNCNVDFYSASVLYIIGIPTDLFTLMFAISRMAGWTAHILEQYRNNRLIRPVSYYTGAVNRTYIPIENRG